MSSFNNFLHFLKQFNLIFNLHILYIIYVCVLVCVLIIYIWLYYEFNHFIIYFITTYLFNIVHFGAPCICMLQHSHSMVWPWNSHFALGMEKACAFSSTATKVLLTCNPSQMRQTDYWKLQPLPHKEGMKRKGRLRRGQSRMD